MVMLQMKKHGGHAERSLMALEANSSNRLSLAHLIDSAVDVTLVYSQSKLASSHADGKLPCTGTRVTANPVGEGQRFRVSALMHREGLEPFSQRLTRS